MDVWGIYVGDSTMSYGGSIRNTHYRDYEQFPYGTLEHNGTPHAKDPYSRVQEKCKQTKSEKAQKKDCPFCKEHKKRPLINYMRKRESRKHHESICEDEEEHDDDNLENVTSVTSTSPSGAQTHGDVCIGDQYQTKL